MSEALKEVPGGLKGVSRSLRIVSGGLNQGPGGFRRVPKCFMRSQRRCRRSQRVSVVFQRVEECIRESPWSSWDLMDVLGVLKGNFRESWGCCSNTLSKKNLDST